jgi:hypothetical protein
MATRAQLIDALTQADAAGDTESAQAFADMIKGMPADSPAAAPVKGSNSNPDITPEFRAKHPTISAVDDFIGNSAGHIARGAANAVGMLAPAAANVYNLGAAAVGRTMGAFGAKPENFPATIDPSQFELGNQLSQLPGEWGQFFAPPQADTTSGRMGNAALEALPSAGLGVAGGAGIVKSALTAGAYGAGGQAINETVDPNEHPTENALAQAALMFGPGLAKGGIKAYATSKLKAAAQQIPARAAGQIAAAQQELPNGLTVAQTSSNPLIQTLATQSQGGVAAEAAQSQADALAIRLSQKARRLAPVPVTAPGASRATVDAVQEQLDKFHADLTKQGQDTYNRGAAQVAAMSRNNPVTVLFPHLTDALNQINAEAGDIWTSAPREVQPRLAQLFKFLGADKTRGVATMNAYEAMQLGKAINEQFSATERGAVSPKMEQVFGQLKSAYQNDLTAAGPDPAVDRLRSVNAAYKASQARIGALEDSVVNKVVGSLGTSDPDAALRKMSEMNPDVQRYTRSILLRYSPDTLRALQGHYIDMHLNDAAPTGRTSFQSPTDIHALKPGELAKTGIFDPATVAELNQSQAAVNTLRNFFPERSGGQVGVNLQAGARLAGSAVEGLHRVSPTFLYGAMLHMFSGGRLQRLLLTPEGRNELIQGAKSPQNAMALAQKIALYQQAISSGKQSAPSAQPQQ